MINRIEILDSNSKKEVGLLSSLTPFYGVADLEKIVRKGKKERNESFNTRKILIHNKVWTLLAEVLEKCECLGSKYE